MLLVSFNGKIDIIYIDPPYGKDNLGEFAKTNYENAISRDNLLSMLYSRLILAKQLLNEDGIIYCSIDDKNQAYIKCLLDEIFGEQNFVSCICRECIKGGSQSNNIKKVHDYILVYAKELNENGVKVYLFESYEDNKYYWDNNYNPEKKGNTGLNTDFQTSNARRIIKSYTDSLSKEAKVRLVPKTLCIGSYGKNSVIDKANDCIYKLENQYFVTVGLLDIKYASTNEKCIYVNSKECNNRNYLTKDKWATEVWGIAIS